MKSISRFRPIGAALGAMVLILAACGGLLRFGDPEADASPFATPTTVAEPRALVHVVGDSITEASRDAIAADLTSRGYNNAVFGLGGSTVAANRGRLLGSIGLQPDVLVVELGHNDMGGIAADDQFPTEVDKAAQYSKSVLLMAATLEDAEDIGCVLWLNVSDWTRLPSYDTTEYGARYNEALAAAVEATPNAHLVDYNELFRPSTPERERYLSGNFDAMVLHPASDDAKAKYVELIGSSVDEFCKL